MSYLPYTPEPPRLRYSLPGWFLVLLVTVTFGLVFVLPAYLRYRENYQHWLHDQPSCVRNQKILEQDWREHLEPYVKSDRLFGCPDKKMASAEYRFIYNPNLEIKYIPMFNEEARAHVYLFTDGRASGTKPALQRHKGGANYAFLDGHVKWQDADAFTSGMV